MRAANLCKLTKVSKYTDDGQFVEFYQTVKFGDDLYPSLEDDGELEIIQASFNRDVICGYALEPNGPNDLSTNDRIQRIENFLGTLDSLFVRVPQGQEKVQ